MIQLRAAHPSLNAGRLTALKLGIPSISAWRMTAPGEEAIVLHNLSGEVQTVSLAATVKNPTDWKAGFIQTQEGFSWPSTPEASPTMIIPAGNSIVLFRTPGGNQ